MDKNMKEIIIKIKKHSLQPGKIAFREPNTKSSQLNTIINDNIGIKVLTWVSYGRRVLIQINKEEKVSNCRSVTCLLFLWKLSTGLIAMKCAILKKMRMYC